MEDTEIKVVLVGESNVGKTCIVRQVTAGVFDDIPTPTLGAGYAAKDIQVDGSEVRLQIWDTAGTEKYKGMAPMFYRDAKAALVCFSITSSESFEKVDYWVQSLRGNLGDTFSLFLVGNKIDLMNSREVQNEQAQEFARDIGAVMYVEVSAKTGQGIEQLFTFVAREVVRGRHQKEVDIISINSERPKGRGCCH